MRVKRKKEDQVSVPSETIQNAYIVAVEEDAKRRLEELVYNHKLTPVDITQNDSDPFCYTSSDNLLSSSSTDLSLEEAVLLASMPYSSHSQPMTNGHVEMTEINGFRDEKPKKGKGEKGKKSQRTGSAGNTETPLINNLLTSNSQNSLDKSVDGSSFSDPHSSMDMDDGPHREMAIDVPANFHGKTKSPPKYPSNRSSPQSNRSTPLKSNENARNTKSPSSEEQMERIRKHQEEIRKRNEREEKRAKEEEMLRASLRGSKKMRALAKKTPRTGEVNTAFDDNDDETGGFEEGYVSGRQTQNSRDYMKVNIDIKDALATLQHIRGRVHSVEGQEKLNYLTDLFSNKQFQNAVRVHHKVLNVKTQDPPAKSTCSNSQEILNETAEGLEELQSLESDELVKLLHKPHVKGLFYTHDQVAKQEVRSSEDQPPDDNSFYIPTLPAGDSVKIVHLEKTTEPLGATVKNEGESVVISRIVKGGTADKSGLLHEGDEILDIDGTEMKGKDINEVSDMLANMSGRITFTIYPNQEYRTTSVVSGQMHVKALFNYDPEDDLYIPCRELGISFLKGDILHVINQDDPNWWQAYREGEEDYQALAGLIPSKTFHEQRESLRHTIGAEDKENQKKGRSCSCGRSNKKKRKKNKTRDEHEEVLSYEEMARYYPEPNRRRPIILIGPPNVGRHELRQRLMESDFDRFAAAVPHTSRPKKIPRDGEEPEIEGRDYYFVSREMFETAIMANKFIEYGDFEKNLYGTSVDAVKEVVNNGKICVLNTDPEALYILKNTDLKPYVVFVCPQNMEKLRQIQQRAGIAEIKDEDLKDIIERSREMEDKYGHLFDYVLVNTDMDRAYEELLAEINRIEVAPQWVPVAWTR